MEILRLDVRWGRALTVKPGTCASKSRHTAISFGESSVSETRIVSPSPSQSSEPMPMALLMRPSSPSPASVTPR